ncbi:MAG: glycosyltransferase, partial [Vibrio sp.]
KDRQQALNADHLVACGAAQMIEQPDLSVEKLAQAVRDLDRARLLSMAHKARHAAKLDADKVVAEAIIAITQ